MNYCKNCEKECEETIEVRIKNTRTRIFVCCECSEDIENFTLIL